MRLKEILIEYDNKANELAESAATIEGMLRELLAGIKLHSLSYRVKTRQSLALKIARPERTANLTTPMIRSKPTVSHAA